MGQGKSAVVIVVVSLGDTAKTQTKTCLWPSKYLESFVSKKVRMSQDVERDHPSRHGALISAVQSQSSVLSTIQNSIH